MQFDSPRLQHRVTEFTAEIGHFSGRLAGTDVIQPAVKSKAKSKLADQRIIAGNPVRNTILLRIPQSEFEALHPYLEFLPFACAERLQRDHEPIGSVYFINRGIASILIETADGRSVEVGISGREDMIGSQLIAGLERLAPSVMMQVPGDGFRVDAALMKRILPSLPQLRQLLLRQLVIRSAQVAQNAACNRLHTVKQRLARWLLATHDRIESDLIATTHELLSKMVGTDRPTVSLTVGQFQAQGIIRSRRGLIAILNRNLLERQSCECYGILQRFNAELGLTNN